MKLYKVGKDWAKVLETSQDESGREIAKLIIGEYAPEDYIIIDIYNDILEDVMDNFSDYDIRISPSKEPLMVILRDNDVVYINKEAYAAKKEVSEVLKDISPTILFNAYIEARNNIGNKAKLSNAFQILEGMVNQAVGKNVNPTLIKAALKDALESEFYPTDKESKEYLRAMGYDDILKLILDLRACQMTDSVDAISDDYIREFVSENPSKLNEIRKSLNLELEYRVFTGQLKEA